MNHWNHDRFRSRIALLAGLVGTLSVATATTLSMPEAAKHALTKPAAPQVTVGAGIKQLQFDWEPVPGASYYMLLESPDGTAKFVRARPDLPASVTSATINISVHRHNWPNAQYIVAACNRSGCTSSSAVSTLESMLPSIGYFKASNPNVADLFGSSVALSADGNTLAIGAIGEASGASGINGDQLDNSVQAAGAVYIFTRVGGTWSQQAYIKASSPRVGHTFGHAVALSAQGNTLAVGAPRQNDRGCGQACGFADFEGAVYVFERQGSTWIQRAFLKTAPPRDGANFGAQVELSADGRTMAVNAAFEEDRGASYVFAKINGAWTQQARFPTTQADYTCANVALSGDARTLAIGCSIVQGNSFAAIYTFSQGKWTLRHTLTAEDLRPIPFYVDLDHTGTTLVGGTITSEQRSGVVIYKLLSGTWEREAVLTHASQPGAQAAKISSDGKTIVMADQFESGNARGVNGSSTGTIFLSGSVVLFTRSGAAWELGAWHSGPFIKASNPGSFDTFGAAVAMSFTADTLVIGGPFEWSSSSGIGGEQNDELAPNAGAVYVF